MEGVPGPISGSPPPPMGLSGEYMTFFQADMY